MVSSRVFTGGSMGGVAALHQRRDSSTLSPPPRSPVATTSAACNAAIVNTGAAALVDFKDTTGPANNNKVGAGSIAGSGEFLFSFGELSVGGNNASTEVTGVLSGTLTVTRAASADGSRPDTACQRRSWTRPERPMAQSRPRASARPVTPKTRPPDPTSSRCASVNGARPPFASRPARWRNAASPSTRTARCSCSAAPPMPATASAIRP